MFLTFYCHNIILTYTNTIYYSILNILIIINTLSNYVNYSIFLFPILYKFNLLLCEPDIAKSLLYSVA